MLIRSELDFVAITGTHRWSDAAVGYIMDLYDELGGREWGGFAVVGCAEGIDEITREIFPRFWEIKAPWEIVGRSAGNVRNGAIAGGVGELLRRDWRGQGYAFPDAKSRGTWDCKAKLISVGLPVEVRMIGP